MRTYKYERKQSTTHMEEVWLSNQIIADVNTLLDLYYSEHDLSDNISISKLCNMGLLMLSSLSVDELQNVIRWYERECYK